MMRITGRTQWAACLSILLFTLAAAARAEVNASVDRDQVAIGDTLRLTITATENEDLSDVDLRPLMSDFEVLQRSTSSSTSFINGQRSSSTQLQLDITPRREGTLKIPPMRVGHLATNLLQVQVSPAPAGASDGQNLLFEAEVDRETVYVQGQVILTLRVQQAINLESRSITELQLDNAFVKPLEQKSFQRQMDGRPWLVHEVRYAIFPEQSGTLEIPSQTFSARESKSRRSFFEINSGGRLVRRQTDALRIEVLPRPENFPSATWLPARDVRIEESWSTPPEKLRAGESATRTIRIQGEGLQGAQLPPVSFSPAEGLKFYPDQPVINETETPSGLLGVRQDSAAVVPTRAGTWSIPEVRIPWWDTQTSELRYAVLPGRELQVAAAESTVVAATNPLPAPMTNPGDIALAPASGQSAPDSGLWRAAALLCAAGWLSTLVYLLWSRRRDRSETEPRANASESRAFKQLISACKSGSTTHVRQSVIEWTAALFGDASVVSLEQAARRFGDGPLRTQLQSLDRSLYGRQGSKWSGAELAEIARRLRREHSGAKQEQDSVLELYPAAEA